MFGRVFSVIRLLTLKVRYGDRLELNRVRQTIRADTEISIGRDGRLLLASVNVNTNVHFVCDHGEMRIGREVIINRNCIFACRQKIIIGDKCLFGPGVCIYDHDHVFDVNGVSPDKFICSDVVIEEGCWIGAGVIVLRGTHIGRNSVIGAGTIVKGKIPQDSLVLPAKGMKIIPVSLLSGNRSFVREV